MTQTPKIKSEEAMREEFYKTKCFQIGNEISLCLVDAKDNADYWLSMIERYSVYLRD